MKVRKTMGSLVAVLALLLVAVGPAWAKDSQNLNLDYAASIHGKQLTPGSYQVSWVSHSPEATVTFAQKRNAVLTVEGKWVDRPTRYQRNAIVYSNNPDGSRTIIEIRFAGMNKALTFEDSSSAS